MPLITRAQLLKVAPKANAAIVAAIVDHADAVLPRYGLATSALLPCFVAQMLVESQYLTRLEENLNYSATRLTEVWPSRFPTLVSAEPYAHNPRALADKVYGGRMGNIASDDGWLNRGQGLIATTGADNIARLAQRLGRTMAATRTMLTSPAGMLECAAATYVMLGAPAFALKGDIVGETRAINGGTNGLADRRALNAACRKIWPRIGSVAPAATKPAPRAETPAVAPIIPPQAMVIPMPKLGLLAVFLAAFGISVTGAQAASIDITPLATAGIDYILVPMLLAVLPAATALLMLPLKRFLDQQSSLVLAGRVNDLLDKAISFGAKAAEQKIGEADFHVQVDGFVQGLAAQYANSHAPKLIQQAGGVLVEKIQARLASHVDVLALKSLAGANDNAAPGAPLDLTPSAVAAVSKAA